MHHLFPRLQPTQLHLSSPLPAGNRQSEEWECWFLFFCLHSTIPHNHANFKWFSDVLHTLEYIFYHAFLPLFPVIFSFSYRWLSVSPSSSFYCSWWLFGTSRKMVLRWDLQPPLLLLSLRDVTYYQLKVAAMILYIFCSGNILLIFQ